MILKILLQPVCGNGINGFESGARKLFESLDALGDLKIMRILMSEDIVPVNSPHAAFKVTFVLPKVRFLNDYKSMWQKETLELTDEFYMLLRTMYRSKFGEAFQRVVVFGYEKYSLGQVQLQT